MISQVILCHHANTLFPTKLSPNVLAFIDDHWLHQLLGWVIFSKCKFNHHFSLVTFYNYLIKFKTLRMLSKSLWGLLIPPNCSLVSLLFTLHILTKLVFYWKCASYIESSHILHLVLHSPSKKFSFLPFVFIFLGGKNIWLEAKLKVSVKSDNNVLF